MSCEIEKFTTDILNLVNGLTRIFIAPLVSFKQLVNWKQSFHLKHSLNVYRGAINLFDPPKTGLSFRNGKVF